MQKKHGLLFTLFFIVALTAIAIIAGCDQQRLLPNLPTVYCFTADWCGPCQQQKPYVEAIKDTGRANVVIIDVDKYPHTAKVMGITDIPAYVVYYQGRVVYRGNSAAEIYNYLRQ